MHPTQDNIPAADELTAQISRADTMGTGELAALARRLRSAYREFTIGKPSGTDMFGLVQDVGIGPDGMIFVLDSRLNVVREYDSTGEFVAQAGGPGPGPAELQYPQALDVSASGEIVVADRYHQLKIYVPEDTALRYRDGVRVGLVPEDFCLIGQDFVVQGWRSDDTILHVFAPSGAPLRSFGHAYQDPLPLVRGQLSDGPIACSRRDSVILTMFRSLPVIFAYSLGGDLLWRARLTDFHPIQIRSYADDQGRPAVELDAGPEHQIVERMVRLPGDIIMIQVSTHDGASRTRREPYKALDTYLLSSETGRGVYVGDTLPPIAAADRQRLYAAISDPFPHVVVLRYTDPGSVVRKR